MNLQQPMVWPENAQFFNKQVSPCTNSICHTKKPYYLKTNDQNDHYIPKYSYQKCIQSYQMMTLDESRSVKFHQKF